MEFEISLTNLRFYSYHGVMEEERKLGNEFNVSISICIPVDDRVEEDNLDGTVSYAELYDIISKEMQQPHKLLEKVALNIVKRLQRDYPQIKKGEIKIKKMHPPIPGIMESASVTLLF